MEAQRDHIRSRELIKKQSGNRTAKVADPKEVRRDRDMFRILDLVKAWPAPALLTLVLLAACGGGGSGNGTAAGNASSPPSAPTAPTISMQPSNQSVAAGGTATFTVTAGGTEPLSYQWQKAGTPIAGATASSYTTPAVALADDGTVFSVAVTNSAGSVVSANATLSVTAASSGPADVLTYKNDAARTGQNVVETALTLANVSPATFGLLRTLAVDGKVDAQPLFLAALTISGAVHDVVFVATEHNSVYAFDADTGSKLWQVSLLGAGESLSDDRGCSQVTPEIGITSTPVIDRSAGPNGTIYVVAMSKKGSTYYQRLHALDVTTGAELFSGPKEITATFPNASGSTSFDPGQYEERASLLLANGAIYTSWTSHCDISPYTGWIIAYDRSTLAQTAVLNVAPNSGGAGPAIWMSGGGPAADGAGNVYLLTANGVFETALDANGFPNKQDYGNSFLKLGSAGGALAVADYFTMSDEMAESQADQDLGSGGAMLLPDLMDADGVVRHLAVGAGKDGRIYVVNRDSMGKFSTSANNIWQQVNNALPGGVFSTPAYFNGRVYFADVSGTLKAFNIENAKLSTTPASQTATHFAYPGSAPAISANGTANAIIWAHENGSHAVLHAYDATDLSRELYNSDQNPSGRDHFGAGNKFITPTVTDGKVFVGTTNGVAVFGLNP
jgi:outer membrane protein assembly factor BamB